MTETAVQPAPWVADAVTFGARLALVRQRMGWGNIKTAAAVCGVPAESWRTWERDGVEPRNRVLIAKQIASATGCDYLWLVHGPDRGGDPDTRPANLGRLDPGQHVIARIGQPHRRHTTPPHPTRPTHQTKPTIPRPRTAPAIGRNA